MGMTITEKILANHAGLKKVSPGDIVTVKVDYAMQMDAVFADKYIGELKKVWDPDKTKRTELASLINERVEGLIARLGGSTTVDITMEGIDKEFGVNKFFEHTGHKKDSAIFFGDNLHEGGNDFPVTKTGIPCVAVEGPEDLLGKIERYL